MPNKIINTIAQFVTFITFGFLLTRKPIESIIVLIGAIVWYITKP